MLSVTFQLPMTLNIVRTIMKVTEDFLYMTLFVHVAAAAKEIINSNDIGISCTDIARIYT